MGMFYGHLKEAPWSGYRLCVCVCLSPWSVNVVDGSQQFLTSLLVDVRAQTYVHQVGQLLHRVLLEHTPTPAQAVRQTGRLADRQTHTKNTLLLPARPPSLPPD